MNPKCISRISYFVVKVINITESSVLPEIGFLQETHEPGKDLHVVEVVDGVDVAGAVVDLKSVTKFEIHVALSTLEYLLYTFADDDVSGDMQKLFHKLYHPFCKTHPTYKCHPFCKYHPFCK